VNNNSLKARSLWGRLWRHLSARWAIAVIVLLVLAATIGPPLWKYSPYEQLDVAGMKALPPSREHPMGTDLVSRDVLARMLAGARLSLLVATLAVTLSMTLGSAYVLLVLSLWRPVPLYGLIVLLGATGWFGVSRLVRAEALSARRSTYIEAARALGTSHVRILWRHLLPNVIAPVLVTATLAVGNVIVLEAGLSFLGVGPPPPNASWGSLFSGGAAVIAGHWWLGFFPGLAIVITVLAFNVLGDALRDVLDPRQLHGTRGQPLPASLASAAPRTQSSENGRAATSRS
jgi:peptide/nickel transport system permease protein